MAEASICRYCQKLVVSDKLFEKQSVHTHCAKEHAPDFVFEYETFHLELYTELIPKKKLKKLIRNLPKG